MTRSLRWRLAGLVLALLLVLGLAVAWSASPLKAWLDIDRIVTMLQALGRQYGPVAAVAAFALASTLAVPLVFVTLVTMVAFGPWAGTGCVLVGALIGAVASYSLGRALGREVVQRLGGARVNALSQQLARRGLLAVVALRLVPVAPFAVANMVAGASQIRLRDMVLGTALGLLPSTLVIALFIDSIIAALRQPGSLGLALVAGTLLVVGLGLWALRRWMRRR